MRIAAVNDGSHMKENEDFNELILHDAKLTNIDFNESLLTLSFKTVDGKRVKCTLVDIEQFVCDNLRSGNIILDFSVSKGQPLSKIQQEKLFKNIFVSSEKFDNYISALNTKLIEGDLLLAELSPSYGCEILAICKILRFESE